MVIKKSTILILDDDTSIRTVLSQAFTRLEFNVMATTKVELGLDWVKKNKVDLVITDIMMPDINGFDVIDRIKSFNIDIPIIAISALSTLSTALEVKRKNIFEYFPKPFDLNKLIATVQKALKSLKVNFYNFDGIIHEENLPLIGQSTAMQELYRMIARLIQSDLTVLITGESGTGKELVAKVLHNYGNRKNNSFITINLAILQDDDIENELLKYTPFIHENKKEIDNLEKNYKGTLFLDEIGELSLSAQFHLLKFLEKNFCFSMNNSNTKNYRIIATSKNNLFELVKTGHFREDLFYCLNIAPLYLPPLRERTEDIPLLIQHFLKNDQNIINFSNETMDYFLTYSWPGNIRELKNIITRLLILYPYETIEVDFVKKILNDSSMIDKSFKLDRLKPLSKLIESHLNRYFIENKGQPISNLHEKIIMEVERPLIEMALVEAEGNQIKTASMLGINRNTLRKKMKMFNLLELSKKHKGSTCLEKSISRK
ncbi:MULTISPECIES: sigma-54 dependent transcriptional regulator [unclassified Commensalibacter]|uniref:sigma 54-interacting transcriptional regulator n=2 Tax=Bacteria TaxID=2 RepID=UPI0018DBC516|nr:MULTISPECIES: sigma-54 dependent transcriptional regulator [unclassified Commensalibacter]MBH9969651.1 sigma-54-dependent Fis family transcriptional regulator [Commensalibacter sp. M0265]MBH9977006.1 sigma-54-dependent Fis family transcriptional regulator [Commensalibacter sp. M0266]MBH9992057.1 sigma-54-dependent Fis family transcriptional regulator [Commensalibacter sp. M0270]MBI0046182.1 sigma-54-dependent Fis family transcriptional regulator [Commensalibacter sp. M0267]MBI0055851.1 sigm